MTTSNAPQESLVTYEKLENDIHVITYQESSREAVDAYIQAMENIYKHVTEDDTVRIMIDYRDAGLPPMRYSIQRSIQWTNSLKIHPTARLALVHNPDRMIALFTSWVTSYRFGHLSMQLFEADAGYEKALVWLAE